MTDDLDILCPNCGTPNRYGARFCRTCGYDLSNEQPEPALASAGAAGASGLTDEITAITDPLLQMGSGSMTDLIGASVSRVLSEAGPRQAEVLRRCAVPRWFDAEVLGVLREKADGNDRVLELLRQYSFVRQIDANRFTYHDEVRDALLREWHKHRAAELAALNARLSEYFRQRAAETTPPSGTLPKSPHATTISIAPAGEWDLYTREALYHLLQVDEQAGLQELRAAFNRAEASHRLGDAEALLQLGQSLDLQPLSRLWVRYMRARLERAGLRLDAAVIQLEGILSTPLLDPYLEASARQTLGEVCAETARWVRATEQYRASLSYFEQAGLQREQAETWLHLGEAYQALAVSTGGWHVPAYSLQPFWRRLGQFWNTLLSLPFYIVTLFAPDTWPRPRYLASYHNWLLIWLYRAALACYRRALATYEQLGDDTGLLQAKQHSAEIRLLFGYPADVIRTLDELVARPAAQDPYRRAWLNYIRASALLALGATANAQGLLKGALERFRSIGDARREAAVLAMQSRAAVQAGQAEDALQGYTLSLARFRELRYAAARELVLYDLRAWRRVLKPGPLAQRVTDVLAAEPEKRYVARFPSSQLPLLRVLSVIALPLALLLLALIAPREAIQNVADLVSFQIVYDPWRALGVLAALALVYSGAYALVALIVILFVPLGDLDREQPDYIVTDPSGLSRYDYRGALGQRIGWGELGRWITVDRKLWVRPVSLFSATFLEARDGQDLRIDGITAWYTTLQEDIEHHLRVSGNPIQSEPFGFTVLRSRSGVALTIGLLLLLLFITAENVSMVLVSLLPAVIYAPLSLLAFSGVLILFPLVHWAAIQPLKLRQALGIRDAWAWIVTGGGALMVLVGVLGLVPYVPSLNFGLALAGAYLVGNGLGAVFAPSRRAISQALVGIAMLAALAYVGLNIVPVYNRVVSEAGSAYVLLNAGSALGPSGQTALDASSELISDPSTPVEQRAQAYVNRGNTYYGLGRWADAIADYNAAIALYDGIPDSPAKQQALASAHYNRYKARSVSGQNGWSDDLQTSCSLVPGIGDDCGKVR